jgi:tripartite-type tricarboxylate transporter receptor subunit TctC
MKTSRWEQACCDVVYFAIAAAASAAAVIGMGPAAILAADYPNRIVRIVVPYPAGNTVDVAARTVVPKLAEVLGQTLYVDNRGGANGTIGTGAVAKAKPDGYTLLYASQSIAIYPTLYRTLPFDPLRDFTPIALMTIHPQVMAVNNNLPANSVQELVAYVKAHPGLLNFASTGTGTTGHLAGSYFAYLAGLSLQHIPYNGASQAGIDLANGRVQMMFYSYLPLAALIDSGKLRVLATTGSTRDPSLPNVPTVKESGYPDFAAISWEGMYAPAGTPKEIIDRIHAALERALADPAVVAMVRQNYGQIALNTPAEFADFTRAEIERGRKLIETSGATAN